MADLDLDSRFRIKIDQDKINQHRKININGVNIFFPYTPYKAQIKYMESVVRSLQTRKNCALESPTGTGKTLCLLCACLGYAMENPISAIYYATRTHSQITNVLQELRKTIYKTKIAVISSRDHSCINEIKEKFSGGELNNQCYYRMKKYDQFHRLNKDYCLYYEGLEEFNREDYGYIDIEELKVIGEKKIFCPYYYEKAQINISKIIFIPYNYLISSEIRRMMNISLNNSVVIFDEGHNIINFFEEEESIYITASDLDITKIKLNQMKCMKDDDDKDILYKEFNEFIGQINEKESSMEFHNHLENLVDIIDHIKMGLCDTTIAVSKTKTGNIGRKLTFQELFAFFFNFDKLNTGMIEYNYGLTSKNISMGLTFINFLKNLVSPDEPDEELSEQKIKYEENDIEILSDEKPKKVDNSVNQYKKIVFPLVPYSIIIKLFKFLNFFRKSTKHFVEKHQEKIKLYKDSFIIYLSEDIKSTDKIKRVLKIICINPEFCYRKIVKKNPRSVILTSGTLSPICGLEKELNSTFPIQLENNHVIQSDQILFFNISATNFNCKDMTYNFDFNHRNNTKMLIELGKSIIQIAKVTPGGILLFFTSYSYMNYCYSLWKLYDIITRLSTIKEISRENQEKEKNNNSNKKDKKGENKNIIYFSVFRGSSSEGVNFADDEARLVIIVGLPFSNLSDDKVMLKREYLDKKKKENYNGNSWYLHDCMRAVNQSLGRVIRHIKDYGVLMVIDERYQRENIKSYFSAWLRGYRKMKVLDDDLIEEIRLFFQEKKNFDIQNINKKRGGGENGGDVNLNEEKNNNDLNKKGIIDSVFDVTSFYTVGKNLHKKNKRDNNNNNNKTFLDLFLSQHKNTKNTEKSNKIESMFNV